MADTKKKKSDDAQAQVISEPERTHDQEELEIVRQQASQFEERYKRALADYQNLERQVSEQQMRFAKLATEDFVRQLLTPFDHLHLAAKHLHDKGLDMVIAQFKQVFEQQGLTEIDALGKPFDPETMEVVETREGEDGKVIEVMSNGYMLNGIVIQVAKVVVGKQTTK